MADSDFDEDDLKKLADLEGKSVDEIRKELLRERLLRGKKADALAAVDPPPRERRANLATSRGSPGGRVVRDEDESAEEATERWLEEERHLIDGVHGMGGQTAGGIFGGGAIATNVYDPEAERRAGSRMSDAVQVKMVQVLSDMSQLLRGGGGGRGGDPLLPAGPRGALPGRRRS